jgi:hypothetical protein
LDHPRADPASKSNNYFRTLHTSFQSSHRSWRKHSSSPLADMLCARGRFPRTGGTSNTPAGVFQDHNHNNILSGYNKSQNILTDVLQIVRNKNATDSRDKVFGVLGLVNNWLTTPPILPDYKLTDIEVFVQVTVNWITNTRDLFILTGNMLRRPHIPSWIQDWAPAATFEGTEYHHETGWNALYWKYNASLTKEARSKLLSNSELQLDGIFVDKVSRIALQMVTNDWKDAEFFISSWEEFVDISNNSERKYVGGGKFYDAFWPLSREISSGLESRQAILLMLTARLFLRIDRFLIF